MAFDRRSRLVLGAAAAAALAGLGAYAAWPDGDGGAASGAYRARELFYADRHDEALAEAERWFDGPDDPVARQVAGAVRLERGELAAARPLLQRALAQHLARGEHAEAARDADWLTAALIGEGRFAEAMEAAEVCEREAKVTGEVAMRVHVALVRGKLRAEIGDHAAAREALLAAQQLAGAPGERAMVTLQLGMLASDVGDEAGAAELLARARDAAARHGAAQVEVAARLNLARVERTRGRLAEAEAELAALPRDVLAQPSAQLVAGLVAADRGRLDEASRLLARAAAAPPTGDYAIDIAIERGRIAERAGDDAGAETSYRAAIAQVEQLRRQTARRELRPWVLAKRRAPYAALVGVLARAGRGVEALAIAEQLHARTWLDALLDRAGATTPIQRARDAVPLAERLQADPAEVPIPAAQLLAMLAGREALIYSIDAAGRGWRFHAADGAIAALEPLPAELPALLAAWADRRTRTGALARRLGDALIPPSARAASPRPLYLVAGGPLAGVAFAALEPGGRRLVETRATVRLPGLAALRCRGPRAPRTGAVFLGDADGTLPGARREVTALAASHRVAPHLGADATVERLAAAATAALLHVAVHADGDARGGGLLLAGSRVTAAEIVARGIGPGLAVLAGCATGASRDVEGWGALASAFLVAGSGSVVATLESVADDAAAELVRRFYAAGGAQRPAEALAAAQRELLAAEAASGRAGPAPDWAVFVVSGAGDSCVPAP